MAEFDAIKVERQVAADFKSQAKKLNLSMTEYLTKLMGDALVERLDNGELVDPLLRNLESFELPECCQKIYDDEKPLMKNCCQHWIKAYQNWYGRQILTYKNTLTGMYYSDYVQEYLGQ